MLAWPHSGFHVHDGVWVPDGDMDFAKRLARYCARNPVPTRRAKSTGRNTTLLSPNLRLAEFSMGWTRRHPARQKRSANPWEYRVFKLSPTGIVFRGGKIDTGWLEKELNAFGFEGWEVVGVFSSAIGNGATNEVAAQTAARVVTARGPSQTPQHSLSLGSGCIRSLAGGGGAAREASKA
ncbi:MAG: DUF4177 domain-containing protein [Gemmatimonadaceae bacterium]|nr:DUF4177 domain-containing protein [Gemmatimonadaceae bacterium]